MLKIGDLVTGLVISGIIASSLGCASSKTPNEEDVSNLNTNEITIEIIKGGSFRIVHKQGFGTVDSTDSIKDIPGYNLPFENGQLLGLTNYEPDTTPNILTNKYPEYIDESPLDSQNVTSSAGSNFSESINDYLPTLLGGIAVTYPGGYPVSDVIEFKKSFIQRIDEAPFTILSKQYSLGEDSYVHLFRNESSYLVLYLYDTISTIPQVLDKLGTIDKQISFLKDDIYSPDVVEKIYEILGEDFVPGFVGIGEIYDRQKAKNEQSTLDIEFKYNNTVFDASADLPQPSTDMKFLYSTVDYHSNEQPILIPTAILQPTASGTDDIFTIGNLIPENINKLAYSKNNQPGENKLFYTKKTDAGKFILKYGQISIDKYTAAYERIDTKGRPLAVQNLLWSKDGKETSSNRWRCVAAYQPNEKRSLYQIDLKKAGGTEDAKGLVQDFTADDFGAGNTENPNLRDVCGVSQWYLTDRLNFQELKNLPSSHNPHLSSDKNDYLLQTSAGLMVYEEDNNNLKRSTTKDSGRVLAITENVTSSIINSATNATDDIAVTLQDSPPSPTAGATIGDWLFFTNYRTDTTRNTASIGKLNLKEYFDNKNTNISRELIEGVSIVTGLLATDKKLYVAGIVESRVELSTFPYLCTLRASSLNKKTGKILVFDTTATGFDNSSGKLFAGADNGITLHQPQQMVSDDDYLYVADRCTASGASCPSILPSNCLPFM